MNNRHENQHNRRSQDRPRDEHGRFESESDWNRGRNRGGGRQNQGNDRRYGGGDTMYGSRDDSSRSDYDSYDQYGGGQRQSGGMGQGGMGQGGYQDYDQGGYGGSDREGGRFGGGSSDWGNQSYYGPTDYNRSQSPGSNYGQSEYGISGQSGYGSYGSQGSGRFGGSDDRWRGNRGGGFGSDFDRQRYGQESGGYDQYRGTSSSSVYGGRQSLFGVSGFGGGGSGRGMSYDEGMDQFSRQGSHAGRGPKGYKRSDERIQEDVSEALSQHPEIDASEIEVKVSNGEVTLSGTVTDRNFKRMAEDVAERSSGVQDVRNDIRVQRETENGSSGQNSMKGKSNTASGSGSGSGSKSQESKTA